MPVSLYFGDEEYLLKAEVKRLRAAVVDSAMGGLGHKLLENPSIGQVLEAVGGVYFNLGGQTLIEVRDFAFLNKAATDKADEKQLEELCELLETLDETKHVLFASEKVNRKFRFAKWLSSHKSLKVDVKECKTLAFWQTEEAVQAVMAECRLRQLSVQPKAVMLLVEQMGVGMQPLLNELEKLSVYAGDRPITPEDVRLLSCHNENTFAMLSDWLNDRNRAGVFQTLDELLLRQHPVQLFALTQSWLGGLAQLRYWQQRGMNPAEMAERSKKHPFKVRKDLETYGRVPYGRVQILQQKAVQLEWQAKTGQLEARLAFETLMGA